jgi:hypothetical protein
MPILSKGTTFASGDTVTSSKLNNLVDSAAFVSGSSGTCAANGGLEVSSGQLQVKNGGITPTKLSNGAPTWDTSNNLTVNGTITSGGTISTSGDLAVNGIAVISGAISIGNTVTAAASVASTHKVAISIGGTTYYLLASDV